MYLDFEPKRAAQGLPPDADRLAAWLDRTLAHGLHVIAAEGPRIIGHVMLIPLDNETVELANFVHQSVRGHGLGTALNRAALQAARAHHWRRVWLAVDPSNRAAVRSYTRVGFRLVSRAPWAPEIEMVLDLDNAGDSETSSLAS
jgi:L-amino acid N-acyltransferase YncA